MRSLGWLKFRYMYTYSLYDISYCVLRIRIHRGFPEYLAQYFIIQSSNRSSRKCHVMKFVQHSTSLA